MYRWRTALRTTVQVNYHFMCKFSAHAWIRKLFKCVAENIIKRKLKIKSWFFRNEKNKKLKIYVDVGNWL